MKIRFSACMHILNHYSFPTHLEVSHTASWKRYDSAAGGACDSLLLFFQSGGQP